MKQHYCDYMNKIRPSASLPDRLEKEMLREMRRREKHTVPRILTAAAACAAVMLIAVIGARTLRPQTDVISRPDNPGIISASPIPAKPSAAPTIEPTAVPTAAPTQQPSPVYPPDDVRLELQMSDEKAFIHANVKTVNFKLFQDHLAGSSTHGSRIVEIHQGPELNSPVAASLRPGTAYWPMTGDGNMAALTDEKDNDVGHARRVVYLDESSNTLKEGWKHTLTDDEYPPPNVSGNPVEEIQLPGKVTADRARLLYGRSADAPEAAVLEKDQLIAIGHRVGNWLYVSTEPFHLTGETSLAPAVGWLHLTEAAGMQWRASISQVDLLTDKVNFRERPDGKIIATLDREVFIAYGGATVPGKTGDWHYVSVSGWGMPGFTAGYISADYSSLNTVRLGDEFSLDGVVSAALNYSENAPFGASSQTVGGEKLNLLLERLRNAVSEAVYTTVCSEGAASITLNYDDGSAVVLPLSGDGCTQVRHGPVVYDLKTDQERTERFLNDGGAGLSDILSPIFDEIKFP